jgi:hypothetical protein
MVTRAVDGLEAELLETEKAVRASFSKLLADIAALRSNGQVDLKAWKDTAVSQLQADAEIARNVMGRAVEGVKVWRSRIVDAVDGADQNVAKLLADATAAVSSVQGQAQKAFDPKVVAKAGEQCEAAANALRKLQANGLQGKVVGRCADVLEGARKFLISVTAAPLWDAARSALEIAAAKVHGLLSQAAAAAGSAESTTSAVLDGFLALAVAAGEKLDKAVSAVESAAEGKLDAALQTAARTVEEVHADAATGVGDARDDLLKGWREMVQAQMTLLRGAATKVEDAFGPAITDALGFARKTAALLNDAAHKVGDWLDTLHQPIMEQIGKIDCAEADKLRTAIHAGLAVAEQEIRSRVTAIATSIIDESTRARFQQLEKELGDVIRDAQGVADTAAKGVKLVKALGELPQLPTLTFNSDRAEYVFDDFRKQIETSPFAAKLREIDGGLKELGLSIPTEQLMDQIVPNNLRDVDFKKIFRNFGALDFSDFFKRFRLPEIRKDQLEVTHGVDKPTRAAWVNTRINVQFPEENSLFDFAGLAVTLARMDMQATSNLKVGLKGEQTSKTQAKLRADWGLTFSGARLATFREVEVRFDGSAFDFDIEPSKVELHPALKFVDEFAKKFQPTLPPAVEVVKDSRGMPVGAKAQMHTEVVLPPLGVVEIGPMLIRSGLSMRMTPVGKFHVDANVSVGSRDTPVWVQISYLGGGLWLEARASYEDRIRYQATVGLALGCVKAFNLASVARGSFAFLLFAYAEISDKGGSLRAGMQVAGSARIVGIANASVLLLLEAVHSGGNTEGRGVLDVSIDICWCYTLHVRRDVNHKIS